MKDEVWNKEKNSKEKNSNDNNEIWDELFEDGGNVQEKPKRALKAWVPGMVAVLMAAVLAGYLLWPKSKEISEIGAVAGSLSDEIELEGSVEYESVLTVYSDSNGIVTQIHPVGEMIEEGDIAYMIDGNEGIEEEIENEKTRLVRLTELANSYEKKEDKNSAPVSSIEKRDETRQNSDQSEKNENEEIGTEELGIQGQKVPIMNSGAESENNSTAENSGYQDASEVFSSDGDASKKENGSSDAKDKLQKAKDQAQKKSFEYSIFNEIVEGAMQAVRTLTQLQAVAASAGVQSMNDVADNSGIGTQNISSVVDNNGEANVFYPVKQGSEKPEQNEEPSSLEKAENEQKNENEKSQNEKKRESDEDFEAVSALRSVQSEIEECQSKIKELNTQLENYAVRSQKSGMVLTALSKGSSINEGDAALTLGQGDMIIRASAKKDVLKTLKVGMAVRIRCEEMSWAGSISKITSDGIEIEVPTGFVESEGTAVDITVLKEESVNSVLLPENGVANDENGDYVLLNLDGVLERRDVATGLNKGGLIVITQGLSVGDKVIENPSEYKEGDKVKIAE